MSFTKGNSRTGSIVIQRLMWCDITEETCETSCICFLLCWLQLKPTASSPDLQTQAQTSTSGQVREVMEPARPILPGKAGWTGWGTKKIPTNAVPWLGSQPGQVQRWRQIFYRIHWLLTFRVRVNPVWYELYFTQALRSLTVISPCLGRYFTRSYLIFRLFNTFWWGWGC